jgi:hypothetical protein
MSQIVEPYTLQPDPSSSRPERLRERVRIERLAVAPIEDKLTDMPRGTGDEPA